MRFSVVFIYFYYFLLQTTTRHVLLYTKCIQVVYICIYVIRSDRVYIGMIFATAPICLQNHKEKRILKDKLLEKFNIIFFIYICYKQQSKEKKTLNTK